MPRKAAAAASSTASAIPLKQGLQLKNWVLGERLGAGACSEVYLVTPLDAKNQDDSYAMKISPIPNLPPAKGKKRKKTDAERNADALYAEHLLYQNTIQGNAGFPSLPRGAYGEDKGYRFLVLERLGKTLEDIKKQYSQIPESTAARLGIELLRSLQYLHQKNILFVDVKPENFMVGRNARENTCFIVDFGLAERFILYTKKHKEFSQGGTVVGTPTYLSLNCHEGTTPGRRDDIEGLLYVLLDLMRGDLPWAQAKSDADGAKKKRDTDLEDLCRAFSNKWKDMLENIRECEFADEPDYEYFFQNLKAICGKATSGAYNFTEAGSMRPSISSAKRGRKSPAKASVRRSPRNATRRQTAESEVASAKKERSRTSTRGRKKAPAEVVEIEDDEVMSPVLQSTRRKKSPASGKKRSTMRKLKSSVYDFTEDLSPEPKKARVTRERPLRRTAARAAKTAVAASAAARAAANAAEKTGVPSSRRTKRR